MKFRNFGFSLVGCVALLGMSMPAGAVVIEVGDAGDSLATAIKAPNGTSRIEGTLNANPDGPDAFDLVDIYRIRIVSPVKFFVTTGDGSDLSLIADPVLYLFDSAGMAVAMNDDANGSQSAMGLPAGFLSGFYFLGISFAGVEPIDGDFNSLFDVFGSGEVLSSAALGGWTGGPLTPNFDISGLYAIDITDVPEPGSFALLALGLLGVAMTRRARSANV